MINQMILSKVLRDGWVQDCLEVKVFPLSVTKINFKQKLWITDMKITSPIELHAYKDGEYTGLMRLSPEDFEYRYRKELIGFAEFLGFTVPVYRFERKEPLSKLFFPIECDTIALTNRDEKVPVTAEVCMFHPPNLSREDFSFGFGKIKEVSEEV